MKNFHREQPWRKPPAGWRASNVLYTRTLTLAQRTGCQKLIDQVKALEKAPRADIVIIMEAVSRAVKGRIDPASLNLQEMIETYRQEHGESYAETRRQEAAKKQPVSQATGSVGTFTSKIPLQEYAKLLSDGG